MSSSPTLKGSPLTFDELTKVALLGTGRASWPSALGTGDEQALLAQLDSANRETMLLAAAAVLSTYRRSGASAPASKGKLPVTAPKESFPRCSPAAASLLKRILTGEFVFLLPEFLSELASAKQRVPEELLPKLLDAAKRDHSVLSTLGVVAGSRGGWLADLNPEWGFASSAAAPAEWETSSRAGRVALLRELRLTTPEKAIELLQSTWKQDSADDRAAFVAELATGLSPSDEPFLEAALDDKRKEVRRQAVELLVRLPSSALAGRMQRAAAAIAVKAGETSKLKKLIGKASRLEVSVPQKWNADWQRDGIEEKSPTGKGEKAWWIHQIAASVPLKFWESHLAMPPKECVEAAAASEFAADLLTAWADSVKREDNQEWAKAILGHAIKSEKNNQLLSVVSVLTATDRDPVLISLLKKDKGTIGYEHPGLNLLQPTPGPWSEALGQAVLDLLQHHAKIMHEGSAQYVWHWFRDPEEFAKRMPLSLSDAAQEEWIKDMSPAMAAPIKKFQDILAFRARMNQEIHK